MAEEKFAKGEVHERRVASLNHVTAYSQSVARCRAKIDTPIDASTNATGASVAYSSAESFSAHALLLIRPRIPSFPPLSSLLPSCNPLRGSTSVSERLLNRSKPPLLHLSHHHHLHPPRVVKTHPPRVVKTRNALRGHITEKNLKRKTYRKRSIYVRKVFPATTRTISPPSPRPHLLRPNRRQ